MRGSTFYLIQQPKSKRWVVMEVLPSGYEIATHYIFLTRSEADECIRNWPKSARWQGRDAARAKASRDYLDGRASGLRSALEILAMDEAHPAETYGGGRE